MSAYARRRLQIRRPSLSLAVYPRVLRRHREIGYIVATVDREIVGWTTARRKRKPAQL